VPLGSLEIKVARGPGYPVVRRKIDAQASVTVPLPRLAFPVEWWSGDLHVHMNYGGRYRNTSAHLVEQARAEGLDLVTTWSSTRSSGSRISPPSCLDPIRPRPAACCCSTAKGSTRLLGAHRPARAAAPDPARVQRVPL